MSNPPTLVTPKKQGRGCFFYGCLVSIIITILLAGLIFWGIKRSFTAAIDMFTTTQPIPVPTVVVDQKAVSDAKTKFTQLTSGTKPGTTFSFTANEINQLISSQAELSGLKNAVFVDMQGSDLNLQVNIPLKWLEGLIPGWIMSADLSSRYVAGKATGTISIEGDEVLVQLSKGELNGHEAPQEIINALNQGFKEKRVVQGNQEQLKKVTNTLQKATIENGVLSLTTK